MRGWKGGRDWGRNREVRGRIRAGIVIWESER